MKGGVDYTTDPPHPVPVMRCPLCAEPLAEHHWFGLTPSAARSERRGVVFVCAEEPAQNEPGPPSGEERAG